MANLTCIYWVHGSGGDLVQQMLVATGNYANNGSSLIDNTGRALPVTDSVLLKKFPVSDSIGWYNRTWTENELDQLESLAKSSNKSYIVGTHSKEQFDTLSKIPNSTRIGVTYDREIFPAVLKLWARKAAESSVGLNEMYQTTHPVISKKFQEKGLYAEFILNEFLKYVRNIPQEIKDQFEINVDLGDLLNQNLNSLSPLLTDHSYKIFASWYQLQDPLYKYRFKNNFHYAN